VCSIGKVWAGRLRDRLRQAGLAHATRPCQRHQARSTGIGEQPLDRLQLALTADEHKACGCAWRRFVTQGTWIGASGTCK
jgi:hypothetical protein